MSRVSRVSAWWGGPHPPRPPRQVGRECRSRVGGGPLMFAPTLGRVLRLHHDAGVTVAIAVADRGKPTSRTWELAEVRLRNCWPFR